MVDVAVPLDWKVRDKEDEEILEYQDLYIYRHYGIQRGRVIPTRSPDIVIISRTKHTTTMVDVAVPLDWKVRDKEDEEILEYQDLYIYRHYGIQRGGVIPTRTPDIVMISRTKHTTTMVDVAVPLDWKVRDKEDEEILEYQDLYIYRHYGIQRGRVIPTRSPDIVMISRTKHTTTMVDVAVPLDWKVRDKEDEEILEY